MNKDLIKLILERMESIDEIVDKLAESNITSFTNALNTVTDDSTVDCDGKQVFIHPLGKKSISEDIKAISLHLTENNKEHRIVKTNTEVNNIPNSTQIELKHVIEEI